MADFDAIYQDQLPDDDVRILTPEPIVIRGNGNFTV